MEKAKIFMIMPFEDPFFEVYEMLKISFQDKFTFSNAGDIFNQQNILKDIILPIYEADIIIADLTGLNANVMYELGVAHTFNKKTIVITQDELSKLPFDLKQYRAKDYTTHFKRFADLVEYLNSSLNGDVTFSNPIKDFLQQSDIEVRNWFSEETLIKNNEESDMGFLDFLAEIENDTNLLTDDINELTIDLNEMSRGITEGTTKIERENKNGGSGTASFVRKETKKIAGFIDIFDEKLRKHNTTIYELWDRIEKNTLGLLENKFASNSDNKDNFVDYLISLHSLQNSIKTSNASVQGLIESMENSIGFERSMNQALKFVKIDLNNYISTTERMSSSIDKILDKSKFVVGPLVLDDKL